MNIEDIIQEIKVVLRKGFRSSERLKVTEAVFDAAEKEFRDFNVGNSIFDNRYLVFVISQILKSVSENDNAEADFGKIEQIKKKIKKHVHYYMIDSFPVNEGMFARFLLDVWRIYTMDDFNSLPDDQREIIWQSWWLWVCNRDNTASELGLKKNMSYFKAAMIAAKELSDETREYFDRI